MGNPVHSTSSRSIESLASGGLGLIQETLGWSSESNKSPLTEFCVCCGGKICGKRRVAHGRPRNGRRRHVCSGCENHGAKKLCPFKRRTLEARSAMMHPSDKDLQPTG